MRYCILTILAILFNLSVFCQLSLSVSSQVNTKCNSSDCDYTGPSILINEIMLSPSSYDGSLIGEDELRQGEWIELYNPDLCNPVDISCFIFGNNTPDIPYGYEENYGGGYVIPSGSVVPPGGFAIIRGVNAPGVASGYLVQNGGSTIEITVDWSRVCLGGGNRFWLPNAGGWLALYNSQGVPQDAILWNNSYNSCTYCPPCTPAGPDCSYTGTLDTYDEIPAGKKNYITFFDPQLYSGQSFRRIPDGGVWENDPDYDTYGTCNQFPCITPSVLCDGTASVIVAGGAAPYTYSWNDSRLQHTATATQLCAGTYCVTVTDVNQNTATACVTVLDFKPDVNLNSFSGVCANSPSFYLTGGTPPGQNINDLGVYSGNGVQNNTFIPSLAGTGVSNIIYTYTNENGCFNSDTSSVTVYQRPSPSVSGELSICYGHSTTLDAGAGFINYHWSTLENTQSILVSSAGVYNVTVTDNNGCTGTDLAVVAENSAPPVINGMFEICSGDSTILDAGNGYPVYEWNTQENTQNIVVTTSGSYSVTVTNTIGCTSVSTVNVIVNPIPDANFTSDVIQGCEPLTVAFSPMNPQPDINYSWNFIDELEDQTSAEMYPVHTFTHDGIYDVNLTALSTAGCNASSYRNDMITVFKQPRAVFDFNPPFASLADPEIFFSNHSLYSDNHVWIFGDGEFSYEINPSHTYNNIGNYVVQLIVTTNKGCLDTAISIVTVDELTFYAPTAFSPDNLLQNNVFFILGNGISMEDFTLFIFDRWGQILFETHYYSPDNPAQYGWNGCFRSGEKVPVGSYTWLVYYLDNRNNKHERTGVVNVIR